MSVDGPPVDEDVPNTGRVLRDACRVTLDRQLLYSLGDLVLE